MKVRINWNQGKVAADGLVRVHMIITNQRNQCQFRDMIDYSNHNSVLRAEAEMKRKGYSMYKRCSHCWDGRVIQFHKAIHRTTF